MHTDIKKIHTDNNAGYKHQKITEKIIGCAFEVQNNLGCGFLEKVYYNALVFEFRRKGLKAKSQKTIKIFYKDVEIGKYIADFVIEDKVIVEIKTVGFLAKVHMAQMLNYLKASRYSVGLILNFAQTKLEYKRLVI